MRKINLILSLIFCLIFVSKAQKVGLVLSGGGAKGISHIGIIKALEENNIPIDYITGTSMGAIVGGMYAMGYSSDEMIEVIKSNDFKLWSTGEIESNYKYYYRNADPKPTFVEIPFRINKVDSINFRSSILPTNIVSPRQMNFAFVQLCAQGNAVAGGDFDKLFVPFRCVASDIYNKEAVVFRYGVLGDAIRASMSYPFMFKPVMIDNRLLFDGGIFNNFPVDVMRSDFKPDFMIGSVVAKNPRKPDQNDILMQIQNMIMTPTDYSMTNKEGLLLRFHSTNFKLFDFSRVDELVQMGYDSIMKHIDEIKARVPRRVSAQEAAERRQKFKGRYPELKFQRVIVEGIDSQQKQYVEQVFHYHNEVFTLKEFKEAYFKLISDDKIQEVVPHAIFNSATGNFDLHLDVKTRNHLKILLGGNVSSSTSNQAYFGLSYQNLSNYAQSACIDAQFGKVYNGLGLGTRIEIPAQRSWYVKLALVLHKFDYFEGDKLFYSDNRTANFTQNEAYTKMSIGFPMRMNGRLEFGVGYGYLSDKYFLDRSTVTASTKEDESHFSLGSLFSRFESFTLNNTMYPTKGYNHSLTAQLIGGAESYEPLNEPFASVGSINDLWVQLQGKFDNYFPITDQFTLGTYGEFAFSTRGLLQNYTVSLIQAPAFRPTPYTRTSFNDAFCAYKYAAIGLKPIYNFSKDLHIRSEVYWFVPYKTINRAADNSAYYSKPFKSSQFLSETALVYNFKIASAGVFVNYSSTAVSRLNFGLNIGFLLFNPKFTE
jgi:NTE family protein